VLLRAQSQKASKGHHSIGNPTADFFDHQTLDTPDIIACRIVYRGALYPITLDERFARHCF
jgi:hypothetical protein